MNTKTDISLFGTLPPIKGISEYCIEQSKALSTKLNVEFHSFSSIYPEFLYPGGTKEYSKMFSIKETKTLHIKRILSWYNPLSWIYVGLTSKGTVTHINWWIYILFPIFFTIAVLSKLRGKKVILTLHNVIAHESNMLDRTCSSIMYRFADTLLVHTEANKNSLLNSFHIPESKIHILPYGPLNFLKTKSMSQAKAKAHFGLTSKNRVVLFFGTIRKYKGLDILINAFSLISKKDPHTRLIIAGKNWIDWKPFERQIQILNLSSKVLSYIQYIPSDDIPFYFTAADVVALPYTHFDAQSGVGNIAAAYGKPIVTSDIDGLRQLPNCFPLSKLKPLLSNTINITYRKPTIWNRYTKSYLNIIT